MQSRESGHIPLVNELLPVAPTQQLAAHKIVAAECRIMQRRPLAVAPHIDLGSQAHELVQEMNARQLARIVDNSAAFIVLVAQQVAAVASLAELVKEREDGTVFHFEAEMNILVICIWKLITDMCTQNTQAFGFDYWVYTQYSNPNTQTQIL